jgi:phosphate-selective porin
MKQSILLSALPLVLAVSPALAQAPAPAPEAPAAAAATPAPVTAGTPTTPPATADASLPAAPPPPEPVPVALTVEEQKKDEAAAPPDKVTVAKTGYFQPSANLQVWAFASHLSGDPENEWNSTFRVRRAEIKAKGEIVPKTFGYTVMFDVARLLDFANRSSDVKDSDGMTIGSVNTSQPPSGGSTSILQDVALTWMSDYADVSIGQFKIPVSLEGAGSASKLYFPERALVSRKYGDRRDLGLKAEKKFDMFGYTLGLYNGEGQNKLDSNDQKDLSLRVEVYPIKELTLAAVVYTALGDRELAGTKDRLEGDLKLEMSNVLVQAEYIRGWDMPTTDGTRLVGQGFYVTAGYTLFDKLQPIVRIGSLDPDIDADNDTPATAANFDANDEYTTYEFGANYYFKQHDCKLQLAGGFFDPEAVNTNTRFDLTLAAQIAF